MTRMIPIWFDIDGTLLHTKAGHGAFRKALREVYGWEETLESVVFAGNTDLQVLMDLSWRHGGNAEVALPRQHAFFERMARHLDEGLRLERPEPVPGAAELVAELVMCEGLCLGLLTGNARDCAFMKLRHLELHEAFSDGGFGDEHADRNVLAARAREKMTASLPEGVELAEGWVIGDTPRDVLAAQSIGARCLGVASGAYSEEELLAAGADEAVRDLTGVSLEFLTSGGED